MKYADGKKYYYVVKGAIPKLAHVWAPEWFVEGSTVNLIANMDAGAGDFQQYLFTALDASLTRWGGPVLTGIAKNHIDTRAQSLARLITHCKKRELETHDCYEVDRALDFDWSGRLVRLGLGDGEPDDRKSRQCDFLDPQQSNFFIRQHGSREVVKGRAAAWDRSVGPWRPDKCVGIELNQPPIYTP